MKTDNHCRNEARVLSSTRSCASAKPSIADDARAGTVDEVILRIKYAVTRRSMLDGILLRSNFALQVASMALVFGGTTLAMSLLKGPRPQSLAGLATLLGIFSLGGLGFGLAMSLVFRFLLLQYRVWRFHRQNPILFGEVELVLGDDGVEFTDSRSAARYSWTDVKGYKESGKGFLLRLSKSFAFFLPKQNQSPAAIDEFRDICGRNARRLR